MDHEYWLRLGTRVQWHYLPEALQVDRVDGLSMEFDQWRFNVRMSNTEPVVRLNVESRADRALMESSTAELLAMIRGQPAISH